MLLPDLPVLPVRRPRPSRLCWFLLQRIRSSLLAGFGLALAGAFGACGANDAEAVADSRPVSACRRCLVSACAAPVERCEASGPCLALDACLAGCEADAACVEGCYAGAAAPAREAIESLARCTLASCGAPCGLVGDTP